MDKEKKMLKEAIQALYKAGANDKDIRTYFTTYLEEIKRVSTAKETITKAILDYINAAYPEISSDYSKRNVEIFVANDILGVVDKDAKELIELKNDGFTKYGEIERDIVTCGTGTLKVDEEALKKFIKNL